MIAVTVSTEIERPAADVFAYLADFANNPKWQSGMQSAEWTSQPPVTVGSTYDQVARFMGREVRTSFEVTALDPGRSITIASVTSPFPISVTRTVEALGDTRCRATADVSGGPKTPFGLGDPVFRFMVRRSVTADYARLKALLEEK